MRYVSNGKVQINAEDIAKFNERWPCSPISSEDRYVEFDRRGNLVDHDFPLAEDGPALVALIEQAQAYLPEKDHEW